ncbi:hypothetical protein [Bacillus sp. AFS017336]|uniref:hypothetical protein n=1 Tax=Bacillus sp. AFS017336 TaxID=2033489 RepID=UPI000BF0259E|nr:hypothetical protein [Bacillus sp. AFS017336]PEL14474.1 hypothetical protein CN601_00190 [Bacillus sp. AFS017336]
MKNKVGKNWFVHEIAFVRSFYTKENYIKRLIICGILFIGLLAGCGKEPKTNAETLVDLGVPKKIAEVVGSIIIETGK